MDRISNNGAARDTKMTTKQWTKNELLGADYLGEVQSYIVDGRYGVMGTPGKNDWCVVHAADGSGCNAEKMSESDARKRAERMNAN